MRFWSHWAVAGLVSLAVAQSDTAVSSRTATRCRNKLSVAAASSSSTDSLSTSPIAVTSTSTTAASTVTTAVVVATDSTGQFTAIGDAISYAQSKGIPTVTVKAGTYTQVVTVSATPAVTVVGETVNSDDYAQNQVIISTANPLTISVNVLGITFKNINFVNTATDGAAATIRGSENAFYDCQFISAGSVGINSNLGLGVIANSYIEAGDKLIYGYPSLYVFNTKIVPTGSNALLVYNKGYTSGSTLYNSTVVFDSCSVQRKEGTSNKNVYLAAANNSPGSVVVYRNTLLGDLIAGSGVHVDSATQNSLNFYGEYGTAGAGSYANNRASRSQYVSLMSWSDLERFSVEQLFAGVYPQFASSATTWVEGDVLAQIAKAAVIQTSSTAIIPSSTATSVSTVASSSVALATPTSTSTLIVSQNPTAGQYANVSQAIAALPDDGKPYTIYIKEGTYTEQLSITRAGKVTLRGETSFENDYTQNRVTIQFSFGVLTSEGRNEETPVIYAKKNDGSGLALHNINFVNTYPQTKNTAALAADFYGSNMAAYGCSFVGYQDTLLANKGTQVFSNCYIEGSVDYIWGFSTAYFHQCYLATNTAGTSIAAQSRSSSTAAGGYVFDSCYVTYTSSYGTSFARTYLGRPYSQYSIAIYMNSYLDKHIIPAGWDIWSTSSPNTDHVTFGEYGNSGPGAWSSERATFATNLTAEQAAAYSLSSWIGDTSWLDMTAYNYVPSYPLTGPSPTNSTSTATSTPVATATAAWGHPANGTTPPTGAVLVSLDESIPDSYSNLTAALAALPNDASTQIIFMYPGTYNEQVPSINRKGPVQIIGYQSGSPGATYQTNQVTLTFARGLSVSPLPSGHSNAETATFATTSNKIALYNINIINTENLDGSQSSYVTLAASIYGSQIGFYGCSFIGWQDTLLTGSTAGYQYYESCYIEGAIDFIWGYSKAYFKGCTIGAKKAKSAIVAQSRASSAAIGGYIFDQCLFDAAPSATVDLTKSVYLGRPYSAYSLVVVKNSYLSNVIQPAGWKVWSNSDPRTDYITFAEYQNSGPGSWENNVDARQAFGKATLLQSDSYTLDAVMGSTDWIDLTHWDSITVPVATPSTTPTATPSGIATPTPTAYDGTVPPTGAYIVSKTPIENVTTYETIQSALDALPTSSKVTPTVFIYPGVYHEQLVLSRSGTTVFIGYSTSPFDYASNAVTIEYNAGVDTQADQSNSDSATFYATGNVFQARNINFVNDFGGQKNYASLGFAVRSSKYAALYGCQVKGNQDALLINGYLFASNSYIEGNIDMIWGSGAGYFLKSTIASNRDGISLTAGKRASATTAAGFVFDQCTVVPTTGAGSMSSLSLGRPWNALARVAYIASYLDSSITAAGWDKWSSSSPNTDGVLFGEYQNYGPGAWNAKRASFATQLDDTTVAQFQLANFFATTSWIDLTSISGSPFVPGSVIVSSTAVPSTTPVPIIPGLLATVTNFITVTDKQTVYTTVTSADKTTTAKFTVTEDVGLTITAAESTKTTTQKTTIASVVVITEPTVTSTRKVVITSDVGQTITHAPVTKTTTVKQTSTVVATITEKPSTVTVKSTITSSAITTVTPKASTTTSTAVSTVTSIKTSTPGTVKTTSTITVTKGTAGTTTTTAKATTTTQTVTSTVSRTESVTTTLSCVPAKAKRELIRRANTVTVTEYTTFTTFVKTSTIKLPASTTTVSVTSTKTTGKTTTLRAPTSTLTVVSTATKATTSTIPAITTFITQTSTSTVGKTTTLKASTTTITATSLAIKTSITTVHGVTETFTSLKTTTVKSTVSLPRSTLTVTKSAVVTVKSTVTLATPTTTVVKTTTLSLTPSVTITSRATSTKTTTAKTTVIETHTVTKTAKGALACPTD